MSARRGASPRYTASLPSPGQDSRTFAAQRDARVPDSFLQQRTRQSVVPDETRFHRLTAAHSPGRAASSALSSTSFAPRPSMVTPLPSWLHSCSSGTLDHQIDRSRQPAPVFGFLFELRPPRRRQRIKLRLPSRFRLFPLGLDPPALFEAVQGRIERSLLYLQHFAGNLLDPLGDRPAVLRLQGNGLQDQQVQSPLHQIIGFAHTMTIYTWYCR